MSHKIKPFDELVEITSELKEQRKRIVHCHGVFDLMHPGLIRYLDASKRQGDVLVVTLTPDKNVAKGPGRPVFNQRLRAETLAALQSVDYVAINEASSVVRAISLLQPDVYARGAAGALHNSNWTTKSRAEEERAVRAVGGIIYVNEDLSFSSTHLLNAHFDVFPPETDGYLRSFRKRYTPGEVISRLEELKKLRVLVVGDAILDEYHFCRPYGMASKTSAIASQFMYSESYAGGVLAVANHLAGFCEDVHLITCLGEQDSREEFIRQGLKANIETKFLYRSDAPTIVKRRYVQSFLAIKLFEVSFFNDRPLPSDTGALFRDYLSSVIGDFDLVIVADYGHGLIGASIVELLSRESRYLAVNAQLNSVNQGFNVITKFPRMDYVCIDEEETRMACRERYGPLEPLMEEIAKKVDCRLMTVTRGYHGSITFEPGNEFVRVPVLSREVVDTIGAGDAYLSITSLCAYMGYPAELVGFVGNAVGALAVRIIGNKESVEPSSLFRFINSLLK